jgi:predicted O-methyltransferase YrrM
VSDVDQFLQDTNKAMTVQRMKEFKARAVIVQADSVSAAKKFAPNSLDFVYIDAAHDYRSVWADLQAWFPIVKTGGIIAGHDYKDSFVRKNLVEVKRAVDDFFRIQQLTVNTTTDDNLPTWFVIKK